MASNNAIVNNSVTDKKSMIISKVKSTNSFGGKVRVNLLPQNEIGLTNKENYENNSDFTTFQEIRVLKKNENEFVESVKDTNPILKESIWGNIIIRGEYNAKRESMKIDFLNIYSKKSYYKHERKHMFIIRLFCKETVPDWESGYFKLTNQSPKQSSWIFENLLIDNLKKSYFEVKLYRKKKSINTRLLAEGILTFADFNKDIYKSKAINLKTVYCDKPAKIVLPILTNKENTENNLHDTEPHNQNMTEDMNDDIIIKFSEFKPATHEILLGFGYNLVTNNLIIDVRKCVNIYVLNGNNIITSEFIIQLNLIPEKIKVATNHSYQSHSPEFKQKFHFPISFAALKEGNISFYVINYKTGRKNFFIDIDRNTDEHWTEMITSAPNIIYKWHDLSKYKKGTKNNCH